MHRAHVVFLAAAMGACALDAHDVADAMRGAADMLADAGSGAAEAAVDGERDGSRAEDAALEMEGTDGAQAGDSGQGDSGSNTTGPRRLMASCDKSLQVRRTITYYYAEFAAFDPDKLLSVRVCRPREGYQRLDCSDDSCEGYLPEVSCETATGSWTPEGAFVVSCGWESANSRLAFHEAVVVVAE